MTEAVTPIKQVLSDSPAWGYSIEAEQSVLGGLMLDNTAYDRIADLIKETDFFSLDHRQIFRAIFSMIEANRPADALTVAEFLGRLKGADRSDRTSSAYISTLVLNTPSAANIRRYAEIVVERSVLRALYAAATGVVESVMNSRGREVSTLLDEAQGRFMAIRESKASGRGDFHTSQDVLVEVIEFIDQQYQRHKDGNSNEVTGLPTGFRDLDVMTTGLHPGQLIILAARPKMGKSAFSLNIAENAARATGKTVAIFSMEMSLRELGMRLVASVSQINVQRLATGRLYEHEWPRIATSTGELLNLPLVFNEAGGLSIMELRALARRIKRDHPNLGLVIVDYLQLMVGGDSEANRANQLAEISRGLKLLAKELQLPVIALSQLNRELEKRPNKRPIMSDLRDSGAIEQDADMILFIYRDEVYNPDSQDKGCAEIIIAAQRNGPTGKVMASFRADQTRFGNL
jgi:replicative DNA helicase